MVMMVRLIVAAALTLGVAGLLGCTQNQSHEEHLRSDAEICNMLGHPQGTSEYGICMRALNKRRCEDRGSRDPMCQQV
jgi:hypothetical protein